MQHRQVQQMARHTMAYIARELRAGMTLSQVRGMCEAHLRAQGVDSFWYYDIGAFVFSGADTLLSVSGREYRTPERVLQAEDILTIDLSPQCDGVWGDFARTLVMQNGRVCDGDIQNAEWREGVRMERMLHDELLRVAVPDMTFEQLYRYMNDRIASIGYVNLDFLGNLGHSIERKKEDRVYIERGNGLLLGEKTCFTFEPHICRRGGSCGFKHEDIYCFENGKLKEL